MTGVLFLALALLGWVIGVVAVRMGRDGPRDREPWEGEWDDGSDPPLDEQAAREAEDEFWEEDWEEPEPWD